MPLYNVAVPIVELVTATDEAEAVRVLRSRLERAGFQTYEGELPNGADAFPSEDLGDPGPLSKED
jgi:hypothetical protein